MHLDRVPDRVHRRAYTDPEIFDLEISQIFERTWIYAGHETQLRRPGDYWQFDTGAVGQTQAAITQGTDGMAILGLPAMNGYFVIFDGEADNGRGVIKFARRKG